VAAFSAVAEESTTAGSIEFALAKRFLTIIRVAARTVIQAWSSSSASS
jgi:hypothetical protein